MRIDDIRNGLAARRLPAMAMSRNLLILVGAGVACLVLAVMAWLALGRSHPAAAPQTVAAAPMSLDELDARRGPTGAPLLWKVKGKDSTVYLFGGLHYLRSKMDWMDPRLFQAFDSSTEVYFEIAEMDTSGSFKGWRSDYMASRPVLTEGLTDVEKAQLETILNRYNYTLKDLARVKPMVMAAAIGQLDMMAGGFQLDRGADYTLFRRAKDLKKPVKGMESYRDHFAYASHLDPVSVDSERGTKALKSVLAAHFNTGVTEDIHVLARYWKTGDQRALTDGVVQDYKDNPELNAALLTERNSNWMPELEAMIAGKGTIFVTVGTAHLVGPDGLVARLRAKGYKVERIDP